MNKRQIERSDGSDPHRLHQELQEKQPGGLLLIFYVLTLSLTVLTNNTLTLLISPVNCAFAPMLPCFCRVCGGEVQSAESSAITYSIEGVPFIIGGLIVESLSQTFQKKMNSLQVAAGVITSPGGQVLISLRHDNLHQGGLWEFPGGKIEAEETAEQALRRELKEELGIVIRSIHPLITINHSYPDLAVCLRVFAVTGFSGEAEGREGQAIKWVDKDKLSLYEFPAANRPIITAARLPAYYAVMDDGGGNDLMDNLHNLLNQGIRLIQARFKRLSKPAVISFMEQAYPLCRQRNAIIMLNSECASEGIKAGGIHLTSRHLRALVRRPDDIEWLAASCHNLEELRHAERIGTDFAVLAPVLPTPTHPGTPVLGWERFADLAGQANLPVYALGGLAKADLSEAQNHGGQGIAAIRAFLG